MSDTKATPSKTGSPAPQQPTAATNVGSPQISIESEGLTVRPEPNASLAERGENFLTKAEAALDTSDEDRIRQFFLGHLASEAALGNSAAALDGSNYCADFLNPALDFRWGSTRPGIPEKNERAGFKPVRINAKTKRLDANGDTFVKVGGMVLLVRPRAIADRRAEYKAQRLDPATRKRLFSAAEQVASELGLSKNLLFDLAEKTVEEERQDKGKLSLL